MKKILDTMREMSDRIQILEEHVRREQSLVPDGPICYERMLFSRELWGLTNGLDINTGIFTSQYRGLNEISWSLIGRDENTNLSSGISLYKNDVKLQATGA